MPDGMSHNTIYYSHIDELMCRRNRILNTRIPCWYASCIQRMSIGIKICRQRLGENVAHNDLAKVIRYCSFSVPEALTAFVAFAEELAVLLLEAFGAHSAAVWAGDAAGWRAARGASCFLGLGVLSEQCFHVACDALLAGFLRCHGSLRNWFDFHLANDNWQHAAVVVHDEL